MAQIDRAETDALLRRYFDGETSLEEERRLKEYFCGGEDVPGDLEYARAMFSAFSEASAEGGAIDAKSSFMRKRFNRLRRRIVAASVSAAAVAAIVVLLLLPYGQPTVYCYIDGRPVTDYEEAYEYTQDALQIVSESLGSSLHPIEELNNALNTLMDPNVNKPQKH